MSRRSGKHWNGQDARSKRPTLKIICVGGPSQLHDEFLCAHLAWKPDGINPKDPRWTPAGPVLLGNRGRTNERFVLAQCDVCLDGRVLTREQARRLIEGLAAPGVSEVALRDLAGSLSAQ